MRTFVSIVPEIRRRVTTDNGESLQRRERLYAGRSIRLFQRTRAKQAYVKGDLEGVMRGQRYCTCAFRPRQLSLFHPFLPGDVTYAKPRGSKVARNTRSSRGPGNEANLMAIGIESSPIIFGCVLCVHVYILGYILKPFGGRVGPPWAGP